MKTLREIKDEVAIENGYKSWEGIINDVGEHYDSVQNILGDEICKRACIESVKESLLMASHNADTFQSDRFSIDKRTITDSSNIIIIK